MSVDESARDRDGTRAAGWRERLAGRWPVGEEGAIPQAGVPRATLRVQDPELRPAAGRPEAIPGDGDLRPLADDIPAEPDPRSPRELEPEAGLGAEGIGGIGPARLQRDEEDPGPSGERRQAGEPVEDPAGPSEPGRQVDEEEVDRPGLEQGARERQALVEVDRDEDDQPLETDPSGDRLDRVEAPVEVEPGGDRADRLGLGDEPEGERRPARRRATAEADTRGPGHAPRPEDGVEGREAGADDGDERRGVGDDRGGGRRVGLAQQGRRGERAEGLRRGRSPALPERRQGGGHIGRRGPHRTRNIEQMFDADKPHPARPRTARIAPVLHSRTGPGRRERRRLGGDVAQLGEHRVRIAGVRGSSPLISTTIRRGWPPDRLVGRLGRW